MFHSLSDIVTSGHGLILLKFILIFQPTTLNTEYFERFLEIRKCDETSDIYVLDPGSL